MFHFRQNLNNINITLPQLPGLRYTSSGIFIAESQKVRDALYHLTLCPDCKRILEVTEAALVVNPFRIKGTKNYEWVKKLMTIFSNGTHYSVRQVDYFLRQLRKVITSSNQLTDIFNDREARVECMILNQNVQLEENCECSICLEDLKESQEILRVKCCRHVFHDTCFKEWYKTKHTCPLCRENLSKNYNFDWCIQNINFSRLNH